ncbi:hypothetical protein HKX48_002776 [Thoreauomyces humboldtii]|nr:hypothetical protein HKX48_002776 [Thoreauomyces humboldtii]
MPNEEWVIASRYQQDAPTPAATIQWNDANRAKVDKIIAAGGDLEKTKLKKIVRFGIPDALRGQVYGRILKLNELAEYEKNYEVALTRTHGAVIPAEPMAPSFGGRSNFSNLALGSKGVTVVNHVLCVIAHDFPNLEYCPYVPAVVALLAHHIASEDELLGATVAIVKRSMARGHGHGSKDAEDWAFFPTYRKGANYMSRAFGNLLHQSNKKLHHKLTELHSASPEPVWTSWLNTLLVETLPQSALWRMLDCFVLEGFKALFRFGIAMLLVHRDAILQATDLGVVRSILQPEPSATTVVPLPTLCKAADGVTVARADTRKLQDHHKTLAGISVSDDIHEAHLRYQRGMPKMATRTGGGGPGGGKEGETTSSVMNDEHWVALWSWIPPAKRVEALEMIFTTKEHGTHITNLFGRSQDRAPLIVVLSTTDGAVFGAYVSHPFPGDDEKKGEWYGNGETFLFTLEPFARCYPWVGRTMVDDASSHHNESSDVSDDNAGQSSPSGPTIEYIRDRASMFVMIAERAIHIGGGGASTGLFIDTTLTEGETGTCQTFDNPPLTGTKESHFDLHVMEVFAFS